MQAPLVNLLPAAHPQLSFSCAGQRNPALADGAHGVPALAALDRAQVSRLTAGQLQTGMSS